MRLFLTLLQKEKHVGTLFFHIFVIILAERVIKLCIFFISNKTSNCGLNWIYEKKRKISVLWTLQPMKLCTRAVGNREQCDPPAPDFCRYVNINPIRIKGVRVEPDYAHHITPQPPRFSDLPTALYTDN